MNRMINIKAKLKKKFPAVFAIDILNTIVLYFLLTGMAVMLGRIYEPIATNPLYSAGIDQVMANESGYIQLGEAASSAYRQIAALLIIGSSGIVLASIVLQSAAWSILREKGSRFMLKTVPTMLVWSVGAFILIYAFSRLMMTNVIPIMVWVLATLLAMGSTLLLRFSEEKGIWDDCRTVVERFMSNSLVFMITFASYVLLLIAIPAAAYLLGGAFLPAAAAIAVSGIVFAFILSMSKFIFNEVLS